MKHRYAGEEMERGQHIRDMRDNWWKRASEEIGIVCLKQLIYDIEHDPILNPELVIDYIPHRYRPSLANGFNPPPMPDFSRLGGTG